MVRCGCASDQCSCTIIAGDGVTVSGTGSRSNPYVVTAVLPTSGGGGGAGFVSGMMMDYGGAIPPSGWLACDGSTLNRTAYAALFDAIGTAFGAGDGITTFKIPDLRGKVSVGLGTGTFATRGGTGGSASLVLGTSNLPLHSHAMDHDHTNTTTSSAGAHEHTATVNTSSGADVGTYMTGQISGRTNDGGALINSAGAHTHTVDTPAFSGSTGNAGASQPFSLMQPYLVVTSIIKT